MTTSLFSVLALVLYLAAGAYVVYRLARQQTVDQGGRPGLFVPATLAAAFHLRVLADNFFTGSGLNFGIFNAISLLSWLIVMLLLLGALRRPVANLGMAIFPLAALALLLEMIFPSEHIVAGGSVTLKLHILFSIISYSIYTLAAFQAILLAVQDRHLHNRHPGGFVRVLPPLQTMESLLFQLIGLGLVLQSLSLATGFVFLEDMFAQHLAHKTVLSIIAWLIFATLLWGHWRFGWRGKRAIRVTLSGFAFLLLAYIGTKVVLEIILGYS